MGYAWADYRPEVTARLDEHGGEKEERDAQLWKAFTAECDAAIKKIASDPKYAALQLYVDE